MAFEHLRHAAACAFLTLLLTACGGGGGGGSAGGGGSVGVGSGTGSGPVSPPAGGGAVQPPVSVGEGGDSGGGLGEGSGTGESGGEGGSSGAVPPSEAETESGGPGGEGGDEGGSEDPDSSSEEEAAPNSPPRFTSPTSFSFPENSPVGFTLTVEDPDGDTILITADTSGDGAFFTLNPETGDIGANQTFNFEVPQDADLNNVYEQAVTLSDGYTTVSQTITVTITDADDPPTCSYDASATFSENMTGLVHTFNGSDEDGPGTYTALSIRAEPIQYSLPQAVYDSARLDAVTGELFFDLPLDFEDPAWLYPDTAIAFTTAYRENGQQASCRVIVNIEDIPGIVTSGIKLTGPVSMAGNVGDIDGDGIEELWLEGRKSIDVVQTEAEAWLIFGATLSEAVSATGAASLDIADLAAGSAIRIFTSDIDAVAGNFNGGGEQLIARPVADLDGDGRPELLIGHRTNANFVRASGAPRASTAYLIWGRTIAGNVTGSIDLTNLSAPDGIVIRMSPEIQRTGLDVTSGDFDGDGLPDIVIGAPEAVLVGSQSRSHTFVIFGPTVLGARAAGSLDLAGRSDIVILSGTHSDLPNGGAHVTSVGDLDTDGLEELLVGSPLSQVAIVPGAVIASLPRGVLTQFWGNAAFLGSPFGSGAILINRQPFDLDNDPIPDLLLGHEDSQRISTASAIRGSLLRTRLSNLTSAPLSLAPSNAGIAAASGGGTHFSEIGLVSIGDIDQDGLDDFAVGRRVAQNQQTRRRSSVFIVTGKAMTASVGQVLDLSSPRPGEVLEILPWQSFHALERSIAGLSDIDGDGLGEIVVVERIEGDAYVILGSDIAHALSLGQATFSIENRFEFEP